MHIVTLTPSGNVTVEPDWLRQRLAERALSAREAAELAGVTRWTVQAALRGGAVRTSTLRALVQALHDAPRILEAV